MEKELKTIALLAITLISIPFSIVWSAFVASHLWLWFVVPLGAPAISLAHAAGLMTIKGFIFAKIAKDEKTDTDENRKRIHALVFMFVAPAVSLAFGYGIFTWWM